MISNNLPAPQPPQLNALRHNSSSQSTPKFGVTGNEFDDKLDKMVEKFANDPSAQSAGGASASIASSPGVNTAAGASIGVTGLIALPFLAIYGLFRLFKGSSSQKD